MIWCRFELEGETNYGIVEGDRVIQVSGSPLGEYAVTNNIHPLEQVKLLAPLKPAMLNPAGRPCPLRAPGNWDRRRTAWLVLRAPITSPVPMDGYC